MQSLLRSNAFILTDPVTGLEEDSRLVATLDINFRSCKKGEIYTTTEQAGIDFCYPCP